MPTAIIVHGGAGPARSDEDAEAARQGCLIAARAGYAVLKGGGSAIDAVVAAVATLEDDPQFNAGTGSCLNADGEIEMDASLMDGAGLKSGAVSLVRGVRNPIRLARCVMEQTPHVFLAADGAHRLARDCGLEFRSPAEMTTARALERWREAKKKQVLGVSGGTVGAVALDSAGHVAAATSTGGMNMKRAGRIGDSPIIGAGTYADDSGGGASATGHGEAIIRVCLSRVVVERMRQGGSAHDAAMSALRELDRVKGEAGIITVDRQGRVGAAFNSERMTRAFIDANGNEGTGFRA